MCILPVLRMYLVHNTTSLELNVAVETIRIASLNLYIFMAVAHIDTN